jgi:hypothetical protein
MFVLKNPRVFRPGSVNGTQKPGFFTKRCVRTRRFGKKPGFFGPSCKSSAIKFLGTYRDEVLQKTRAIDPACGSGAFLIATFDYLMQQYEFLFLHISLQTLVSVNFYYAIQHF